MTSQWPDLECCTEESMGSASLRGARYIADPRNGLHSNLEWRRQFLGLGTLVYACLCSICMHMWMHMIHMMHMWMLNDCHTHHRITMHHGLSPTCMNQLLVDRWEQLLEHCKMGIHQLATTIQVFKVFQVLNQSQQQINMNQP